MNLVSGGHVDRIRSAVRTQIPAIVAEKISEIHQTASDEFAIARQRSDDVQDARAALREAETNIQLLTNPTGKYRIAAPDNPQLGAARAVAARARAKSADLNLRMQEREPIRAAVITLSRRVSEWEQSLPRDFVVKLYTGPEPQLRKGESIVDAIEHRQRRLRELLSDLAKIRVAPITTAMAKKRAIEQMEGLAESGRPDVMRLIDHGDPIKFAEVASTVYLTGSMGTGAVPDAVALVAWLHRDGLMAAISREDLRSRR